MVSARLLGMQRRAVPDKAKIAAVNKVNSVASPRRRGHRAGHREPHIRWR